MIHKTLETHLEEVCPSCKKNHGADWKMHFEHTNCYISCNCVSCSYSIFKKVDFMTCGTFKYVDL